ncbi:MAG: hypothetical protein HQM06_17220 [Magnetococcales bacterium]|nr:hypothetical protein [Magnetococcales bacterium]
MFEQSFDHRFTCLADDPGHLDTYPDEKIRKFSDPTGWAGLDQMVIKAIESTCQRDLQNGVPNQSHNHGFLPRDEDGSGRNDGQYLE